MNTKDFILLGAGYAAGRLSKKMNAGPIGAVGKKGARAIHSAFLRKFWKYGFVGDLTKNASKQNVFQYEMDSKDYAEEAKKFLKKYDVKIVLSSINPKKALVII